MNAKAVASCSSRLKAIVAFTVRTAIPSARLFRKEGPVAHRSESADIEVDLPRNGDLVESENIDDDGTQAAHLVRILIARPGSSAE
jgi:hypothetical protein